MMQVYTNVPLEDAANVIIAYGETAGCKNSESEISSILGSKKVINHLWPMLSADLEFNDELKRSLKIYNIYSEYGFWIFDKTAKEALEDILKPYAEFLPLICGRELLYVLNVFYVVDAVDIERSEIACAEQINWDDPEPAIMEYEFNYAVIQNELIFRLPYKNITKVFFTNRFVDILKNLQLTGLGYRKLWEHS